MRILTATGGTVGLAVWIIDGTHASFLLFPPALFSIKRKGWNKPARGGERESEKKNERLLLLLLLCHEF